jgi:hypothetical protein
MRRLFFSSAAVIFLLLIPLKALCSGFDGHEISYQKIRSLIETHNLKSIDEVLSMLPERLRSSFVLMYSSASTQPATFLKPRVLLFSEDARFVMAFNDSPNHRGARRFEIIQFCDETDAFEFYEIRFNPEAVPPERAVFFPDKDPFLCTKCHRDDLRPNWDPFPITEGAYGSSQDRVFRGSDEDQGFREFVRISGEGPYRFLAGVGKTEDHRETSYRLAGCPNTRFGTALHKLNFLRIGRILRNTEGFYRLRYALQAALDPDCCDRIEGFLTDDLRKTLGKSFDEVRSDTLRRRRSSVEVLRRSAAQFGGFGEHQIPDPKPLLQADDGVAAAFRYIAEEAMKADMREWTMTLEVDSFLFTSSGFGLEHLGELLLPGLLKDHPELGLLDGKALCARLRELSLKSVGTPVTVGDKTGFY